MSLPVVCCFTADAMLTDSLTESLGDAATFEVCPADQLPDAAPTAFVIDLRGDNDGGHVAATSMERLRETYPDLPLVAVLEGHPPERLERAIVESAIARATETEGLVTFLDDVIRNTAVEKDPVGPREPADEETSVLRGITRGFETSTLRLKRMLGELEVAARHNVTILLVGETGSGKTFLSKLIHEVSPRRDEPFLHVACGALPADLIESDLFGHAKGAFTSASADKVGKFVAAGRGTILLDEIDVLGPEQQVKLLRVIETGEFEAVGSNETLKNQARLVVASNLDLQPLVEQGRFRPDLYYRLNMLRFEIPPLRERREDLDPLVHKFVRQLAEAHDARVDAIDDGFLSALHAYPWPGNVRELENVIRRAVIFCTDGVLRAEHLPPNILACEAGPTNDPSIRLGGHSADPSASLGSQMALTEREIIEQALFKHNYSKTRAAKELGISRVTLYNKLKKYQMM